MGKIVKKEGSFDVVTAARRRVRNAFDSGYPVAVSFSGGKDSICLADVVLKEIQQGRADLKQLTVIFIDEEAIYPDVERIVHKWRQAFLMEGAQFIWFCLEVRHYNCLNTLSSDESFICWDRDMQSVWVRPIPKCAVTTHPLLNAKKDTYQDFLAKFNKHSLDLIGVRTYESVQRLMSMAARKHGDKNHDGHIYPIYDWRDNDVWRYIQENQLDFPIEYLYMWQIGVGKTQLRISQFFSIDTAKQLVDMQQYYPDLLERVTAREPNAYLAAMYYDTEFFRSSKQKNSSDEQDDTDYKAKVYKMMRDIPRYFPGKTARSVAQSYKNMIFVFHDIIEWKDWRDIYTALMGGDIKQRTKRALFNRFAEKKSKEQ